MQETLHQDGITITMHLNADRSVDLHQKMQVSYAQMDGGVYEDEYYPDAEGKKYATIEGQFARAKSHKRLLEVAARPHGGARVGAGRKPKDPSGKKVQASWTLAPDVLTYIQKQPNQAEYLEGLVRKDMEV